VRKSPQISVMLVPIGNTVRNPRFPRLPDSAIADKQITQVNLQRIGRDNGNPLGDATFAGKWMLHS